MILKGQIETIILLTNTNTIVRLCEDKLDNTYSIGVNDGTGFQWKYISKELHDLLVKELKDQEGQE